MRVEDAAGILEDYLGSGSDPIWVDGVETTPGDLGYSERALDDARRLRITYYGGRGRGLRRRSGTLFGMVRDRLET